jgi:dynein heavy chain 2
VQEWVVLGALDLDQFVLDNLVHLSDWERNFRALKARGRDAEKLPR